MNEMPTVSVLDLKIHPRENDLIAGTHGRSIWIVDDISSLQQMNKTIEKQKGALFDQRPVVLWENVSRGGQRGHFLFAGQNPKTIKNTSSKPRAGFTNLAAISYYVGKEANAVQLIITDKILNRKKTVDLPSNIGIQKYYWNRAFEMKAYTNAEYQEVDSIFQHLIKIYDSGSIKRVYAAFKKAKTGEEQRTIVEKLTIGYLTLDIDPKYLVPRANIGNYQIELVIDGKHFVNTLEIKADPILNK